MKNAAPDVALDTVAPGTSFEDAPTRERVVTSIMENGPSTVAALAQRLSVTPAAIRRHLDHLTDEGTLEAREPKVYGARGRGRPAKVFVLTDAGRDAFTQAYDDLAVSALRFLAESGGPKAIAEFARNRNREFARRYADTIQSAAPEDRTQVLADALTEEGYAASVRTSPLGDQVCQHHCPVAHVAAEFPEFCEAETEVFAALLGRHVQRLATIAHGDGVCTTNVPDADAITTTIGLATRESRATTTGRTVS